MEQEFLKKNNDPTRPYIHPSDFDLEQFLPRLPPEGLTRVESYSSLSQFAKKDTDTYNLYCHGLVAEGYRKPAEGGNGVTSSAEVHRKSDWPSGDVYTQDLNWTLPWAKTNVKDLNLNSLPDPAQEAISSLENNSYAKNFAARLGLLDLSSGSSPGMK